MNVLMGIGNKNREDDGIGPYVADRISQERLPGWEGVDCSITPENFTSVVRRKNPGLILVVDAVEMNLSPGNMRKIPSNRIDELVITTHYIPLSILMRYLGDMGAEVKFIGVQPKSRGDGEEISPEVREAGERLIEIIKQEKLGNIKEI